MEEPVGTRNPVASLSFNDDILVEILSRVPARSLCRFKCVSRAWRDLISHPDHRKKLPQTLTGFFYDSFSNERFPHMARHFTNVTGKDNPFIAPSSSFLPNSSSDDLTLLDSCGGLFLFCCFIQPAGAGPRDGAESPPVHYVVCNPAAEKWVMLMESSWATSEPRTARLCFDPTISPHFYVIEYVVDSEYAIPITTENGWRSFRPKLDHGVLWKVDGIIMGLPCVTEEVSLLMVFSTRSPCRISMIK